LRKVFTASHLLVIQFCLKIVYSVPNTLKKFIIGGKDKIDFMSKNDVVYKIDCPDCDGTYVEQTKKQLRIRIKEYRSDINKKKQFSFCHF